MKAKHTLGPWKQTENKELDCTFIQSPTGLIIAKIRDFGMRGEAKANAQLIASAPELLEAAKYAVECLNRLNAELGQIGDNGDQALQSLEDAIQKAEQ